LRWAQKACLPRVDAPAGQPRSYYLRDYALNLLEPLSLDTKRQFEGADGNELAHGGRRPAKMAALHSSSALACNFFHYWHSRDLVTLVLDACGLPAERMARFEFETKLPIDARFKYAPNLDACVTYADGEPIALAGIECKFCEPYAGQKRPLSAKYLDDALAPLWKDRPALLALAKACTGPELAYVHLDVAQLLKHLLGLRKQGSGRPTHLLYLYIDHAGPAATRHRDEIQRFASAAMADEVGFSAVSYQSVMSLLAQHCTAHAQWFEYMSARYFAEDGVS
jgi:hypothetical protein